MEIFLNKKKRKMLPAAFKLLFHILTKGIDSLALVAADNCISCKTCQKICSVKNIEMREGKPNWLKHCAGCFACFHWCPKNAISMGGHNMDMKQYHHPQVKLIDMMI